jgi:hypothetical protein
VEKTDVTVREDELGPDPTVQAITPIARSRMPQRAETAAQAADLRPWTIEAAMEPLAPLAPPVDSPLTRPAQATQATTPTASSFNMRLLAEAAALVVLVVIAILLLLLRHGR